MIQGLEFLNTFNPFITGFPVVFPRNPFEITRRQAADVFIMTAATLPCQTPPPRRSLYSGQWLVLTLDCTNCSGKRF